MANKKPSEWSQETIDAVKLATNGVDVVIVGESLTLDESHSGKLLVIFAPDIEITLPDLSLLSKNVDYKVFSNGSGFVISTSGSDTILGKVSTPQGTNADATTVSGLVSFLPDVTGITTSGTFDTIELVGVSAFLNYLIVGGLGDWVEDI